MKNNFFLFGNTKIFDQKDKYTTHPRYAYIYDMTENLAHHILCKTKLGYALHIHKYTVRIQYKMFIKRGL